MCLLRGALRLGDTRITQVSLPTDQPYPLLSRTLTADDLLALFAFERNPRLQQCAIVPLVQPRVLYWLQELRRQRYPPSKLGSLSWRVYPSIRPTLNDPKYRTANRNATAGSPEDVWKYVWKYREITTPPGQPVCVCLSLSRRLARSFYADLISFLMAPYVGRYQPWRAPGQAPVFDPCGMAGGVQTEAANGGTYNTTKYAKQGDLGSKVLKPRPTGMFQ